VERMSIGDFARASGLTAKALRLYDEMGLVRPAEVDEFTGYRYYHADQLERARLVARLRLVGMPLGRIAVIAGLGGAARAAELLSYWRQVEADTSSRRSVVADLVDELRSQEDPMWTDRTTPPSVAARTGIGTRPLQLDALLTGTRVHAVADGFGSDPELAPRALHALADLDRTAEPFDPVRMLEDAVAVAAHAVAAQRADTDDSSGCTLTALMLGGDRAAVAHVGDSRVYLVRDGRLERLTRDHTLGQSLVEEGRLTED
jgi:PPM family protein phosphatase